MYRVIIIKKKIKYIHAIKEISVLLFRTELRNGFGGVSNNKNVMWGGGVLVVGARSSGGDWPARGGGWPCAVNTQPSGGSAQLSCLPIVFERPAQGRTPV